MSAVFSSAQLRASLWAAPGVRVHAVIDGLVVPDVATLLKGADVGGHDCLERGALTAVAAARAAYLAELRPASAFTDWLLGEATATYPGWGVLVVSKAPMLRVREHCRSIGEVVTPDGERRSWRWYDPEVLTALLPQLVAGQLDEVFALQQSLVVVAADAWTWLALENGVLVRDVRPQQAGAAR